MKTFLSRFNQIVVLMNLLLIGLGQPRVIHTNNSPLKRWPLLLNLCMLALMGFIFFCMLYAPYLRDKASGQ